MRVTDLYHVFIIVLAVAVLVDPDDVTGLGGIVSVHEGVSLGVVVVDLLLVLEYAFVGDTYEVTDRIARTGLEGVVGIDVLGNDVGSTMDDTLGIVDIEDLVDVVRAVYADAVHQVTDAVVPGKAELDTLVA